MTHRLVHEVIGIYDADGSVVGEVVYALKKLAGRAHCALCDLTHRGLRRRPEFAAALPRLGVPFTLLHRDERSPEMAALSADRTPMVLGRIDDGLIVLLSAEDLERCDADPDAMITAIEAAIAVLGLRLAS
ncbi:MAG: hypothetical protein ABL966_13770 [Acidimicrobiales bacterium]